MPSSQLESRRAKKRQQTLAGNRKEPVRAKKKGGQVTNTGGQAD